MGPRNVLRDYIARPTGHPFRNTLSLLFEIKNFKTFLSHHKFIGTDSFKVPEPELEFSYLCDSRNRDEIMKNITNRKGVGDIDKVLHLHNSYLKDENNLTKTNMLKEMLKIPNRTHPAVLAHGEEPKVVKRIEKKINFDFKPKLFHEIANSMKLLRNDISLFTGHRSYFFVEQLSKLESAMIKHSVSKLIKAGFHLVSVPDILDRAVIESCGMETRGQRSQVYSLSSVHGSDKCLSGTAEMALAAYLMNNEIHPSQLPLRLVAVSRCYRAETSSTSEERGIYRVHQFTKVEMFGVSEPEQSSELLDQFRDWQVNHFADLGLDLQVMDMPPHELGAQAYRKYDVEAWLPAKQIWAELSSCSDCTDYQSRRLNIRSNGRFVHTVNGTACAVPRLLIALFEQHQQRDGSVLIPPSLQTYMGGATHISKDNNHHLPALRPMKRLSKKT